METKRGRKPKVKEETVVVVAGDPPPEKVKRGRKPKATYNNFENCLPCSSDDEHIIMKLNISSKTETFEIPSQPDAFNTSDSTYSLFSEIEPCVENVNEAAPKSLKVVELLKDFEEKNKNNEWPQTTNICCYWCCHAFANAPFGIPLKYNSDHTRFDVFGCFCSLECAAAYNFASRESQDEICERYSLINMLARQIGYKKNVKSAPPRLALTMFGGYLSIEAFRGYCLTGKIININFPPMMTLTQQIEEINECEIVSDRMYIPVDTERINRYKEKLCLKRTKPINSHENTLDHTMNLKFGALPPVRTGSDITL